MFGRLMGLRLWPCTAFYMDQCYNPLASAFAEAYQTVFCRLVVSRLLGHSLEQVLLSPQRLVIAAPQDVPCVWSGCHQSAQWNGVQSMQIRVVRTLERLRCALLRQAAEPVLLEWVKALVLVNDNVHCILQHVVPSE
jgi:hypothetical protein